MASPRSRVPSKSLRAKPARGGKRAPGGKSGKSASVPAQDRSRTLLLEAAKRLFAQEGFEGTSVREIAREAGVNLSLVSYHFKGKEGLYREVMEQFGAERLAVAESMLKPAATREEFTIRLRMAVDEVLRVQMEDSHVCDILHREIDAGVPVASEVFERTFLRVFMGWIRFFEEARKAGIIGPWVDPNVMAQLMNNVTSQLFRVDRLRQRYFKQTLKDPEHRAYLVGQIIDMILCGAFNPERGRGEKR